MPDMIPNETYQNISTIKRSAGIKRANFGRKAIKKQTPRENNAANYLWGNDLTSCDNSKDQLDCEKKTPRCQWTDDQDGKCFSRYTT